MYDFDTPNLSTSGLCLSVFLLVYSVVLSGCTASSLGVELLEYSDEGVRDPSGYG